MKPAAIYARVSTADQEPETQLGPLRDYAARRGWTVPEAHVYVDHGISGATQDRPALKRLQAAVRKGQVGAVLVWRFDRFARSTRALIDALDEMRAHGVAFVSMTEAVDTSTPAGELVFSIFAALAQFERELIRERVNAGIARVRSEAQRRGVPAKLGRPRVAANVAQVTQLRTAGRSTRAIARELGLSEAKVRRTLRGA